ncbi:MAG: N-6 DNA methylase [Candidatus Pacearchaeota archaeon]|jgi:type I restriction-modification system DNA methylase subunit
MKSASLNTKDSFEYYSKMVKKKKREALSVYRLIDEVLVKQLSINPRQIVIDTSFEKYTGSKRPDLLISEFDFEGNNEDQYITNLVAYAEVKDNCTVDDRDWKDAIKQGKEKSAKLNLPYFIVTNCKTSKFYNQATGKEISLNKNIIREFQNIDILRLIKAKLKKNSSLQNIETNVDSLSAISEAVFNKKLWELATIYRDISFKNDQEKIDFTIGFISLKFYEDKEKIEGKIDANELYWDNCNDKNDTKLVGNLVQYSKRLIKDTDFYGFKELLSKVIFFITSNEGKPSPVDKIDVRRIYDILSSMGNLHNSGFDLFGSVYEMFASSKEKKEFGQYFTRRHYAQIFVKLLLEKEKYFDDNKKFTILDPACGTGGFLTEGFKVLKKNYERTDTYNKSAEKFLSKECFYGHDNQNDNILRTKLNMFLVGDGHTNIKYKDSLKTDFGIKKFDYIITNPPYGNGTIKAETDSVTSNRKEIAFLVRVISLLKVGGKCCIILPDGVLENPSFEMLRRRLLEQCDIDAIISMPKFAFAPYTKEKTYALFMTKRSDKITKIQTKPIWMYIIDNDGLANSDKRFPTRLRNNRNGWMHDEISGWVSMNGEEMTGILEERWMNFQDSETNKTKWIDEKGINQEKRKGDFIIIKKIDSDKFCTLLPEYYLRPYKTKYLSEREFDSEIKKIQKELLNFKI